MIAVKEGACTSFELSLSPDAPLVVTVRRFVGELCGRIVADGDVTSRVVVATHELLDNAVRYASGDVTRIRVELHRRAEEVGVVIVTKNRLDEDRSRQLDSILGEMNASSDRTVYYRDLVRRAAEQGERSGLGLGRVHAEAGLDVSGRFEEDSVLIRADGRFRLAKGAPLR